MRHLESKNTTTRCLNVGSYNYLGFGGYNKDITPKVIKCIRRDGITQGTAPIEFGIPLEQMKLEKTIAAFIGKPACAVVPMGFGTNAFILPLLVKKGDLVISDKLNHASIAVGVRLSGAKCSVFKHNDMVDLELKIQEGIKQHYSKILIIVEGMYSMEGETCLLAEIVKLKERYNVFLFVDEAHSVGALGKTGRGVCEYYNVSPSKVDILMGTMTKSFGSIGGYIASSTDVIEWIKSKSVAYRYGRTLPPACACQSRNVFKAIQSPEYCDRPIALRNNAIKFRNALKDMGCWILGDDDSPVIPLLLHHPRKISSFSRLMFARKVAVVCVGYPATPILKARARFCLSAGNTEEDLKFALDNIKDVVKQCGLDYFNYIPRPLPVAGAKIELDPVADILSLRKNYPSSIVDLPADSLPSTLPMVIDNSLTMLSGYDFLGVNNAPEIIESAVNAVNCYGVGSCGPRGFYGTIKPHLDLEKSLEEYTHMEKAAIYSSELPTAVSLLATYNPQVIVCDENVRLSIRKGIFLVRDAKCFFYRHNDMRSLETVLTAIAADPVLGSKKTNRKFIVTEALFENTGRVAHLPRICHLKRKFKYYLILDETISFGALGRTGKGLQEFWTKEEQAMRRAKGTTIEDEEDLDEYPINFSSDVELMVGSLERSLCSLGGFCCGRTDLVELQVLFASSYCFSASAPPYTCVCAQTALKLFSESKEKFDSLRELTQLAHDTIATENATGKDGELFFVNSERCSPLIFFSLPEKERVSPQADILRLQKLSLLLREAGYAITVHAWDKDEENVLKTEPALRFSVSVHLTNKEMTKAIRELFNQKRKLQ
jgi:serine palmitoyltransferase